MLEIQYLASERARHPLYDPNHARFPRAIPLLGLPAASISVKEDCTDLASRAKSEFLRFLEKMNPMIYCMKPTSNFKSSKRYSTLICGKSSETLLYNYVTHYTLTDLYIEIIFKTFALIYIYKYHVYQHQIFIFIRNILLKI